ncbi:MAG: hypothetical protein RR587_14860 [Solibacillus sp.]
MHKQYVFVKDGKINVLTSGYSLNGDYDLHIYTVDENSKELLDDKLIGEAVSEKGVTSNIRTFYNYNENQNDNNYLYTIDKHRLEGQYNRRELLSSQIYLYNKRTNEVEEWDEPVHFNYPSIITNKEGLLIRIMDEKLYVVNRVKDGHVLYIGDLRTGESLYEGKITADSNDPLSSNGKLHIGDILKNN